MSTYWIVEHASRGTYMRREFIWGKWVYRCSYSVPRTDAHRFYSLDEARKVRDCIPKSYILQFSKTGCKQI